MKLRGLVLIALFASACGGEAPGGGGGGGNADAVVSADASGVDGTADSGTANDDSGPVLSDSGVSGDDGGPVLSDSGAPGGDDGSVDGGTVSSDGGTPGADGGDSGPVLSDSGTPGSDGGAPGADGGDAGPIGPDPNGTDRDFDCDGVSDAEEFMIGTDPALADSDGDGILDGIELGHTQPVQGTRCPFIGDADPSTTTDPLLPDSDGDGLADGFEDRNHNGRRDPFETDAASADTDGDGIPDGIEDLNHNGFLDAGETSPIYADTDFDGLDDGIEDANHNGQWDPGETSATNYDTDGDGLRDGCEDRNHNGAVDPGEPDPRVADTDQDGLEDGDEDANHNCLQDANETDPSSSDTDCDGLSDLTELATIYAGGAQTSALLADTDGDGITDGVEAGVTGPVPLSSCSGVTVDRNPATRTNPTLADTDGDGRSDGCEDRNHNGRVDSGEMNPNAADTDGDGLSDAAEDTNGNCVRDGTETSAALADTDGDGIGDAIELATGTNPRLADSDGDGIPDGVEDSNHDGTVDPGETDPRNADTDGDGLGDGAEDANHNGTVDPGETDPRNADTDGDGLTDAQEITRGTNPLNADSDGDGLSDGQEVIRGTNPNLADTDGDTLSDGDEVIAGTNPLDPLDPGTQGASGINAVCTPSTLKVVSFNDEPAGDWQIASETSYTYSPLTVTAGDHAAAVEDSTLGVMGFVVDTSAPVAGTNPTNQAQALILRLTSGAAALGASVVDVQNNGRQITTHDGFGAVVDIRVNLTLSTSRAASFIRNRVMAVVSNHAVGDFSGLPPSGGGSSTNYVLKFESVVRTSPTRVVIAGALVSQARFDNTATQHRAQVEDLSNGTALARAYASHGTGCDPFLDTRTPQADFIWMADTSGSTDNDRGTIAADAGDIFTGLSNNGVDFRMGVVNHTSNHINTGSLATSGILMSGFTTSQTTFVNNMNTSGGNGCEFGLTAADDAVRQALPRSAAGVTNTTKLRHDAKLVVFYVSDEHAQEVEINQCGLGDTGTGLTDIFGDLHEQTDPNTAQQAAIDGIVAPFITRIRDNDGIAFAQIHPLQAPHCFIDFATDEEEGYGYYDVVTSLGGTFYRVCDTSVTGVLTDIIDAVAGAASEFVLTRTPISATLEVGLTRMGTTTTTLVPRSRANGFDYDAGANTIFFHGTTFRPVVGDRVTISYRVFGTPVPPVSCAPPLVLNPVTHSCECPADCGLAGGCTTGQACNRDPAVCACECEPDCGGTCRGAQVCDTASCSCTCAPDCGGTCTSGRVCDQSSCSCSCPADCGGLCTGRRTCDTTSCTCACPADCGGCPVGQRCDPAACACVSTPA